MNNDAVKQGLIDTNSKKYEYSKLVLTHFYGLFYIVIGGYLVALIILIVEYLWSRFKTKIQRFLLNKKISRYRKKFKHSLIGLKFKTSEPRMRSENRFVSNSKLISLKERDELEK